MFMPSIRAVTSSLLPTTFLAAVALCAGCADVKVTMPSALPDDIEPSPTPLPTPPITDDPGKDDAAPPLLDLSGIDPVPCTGGELCYDPTAPELEPRVAAYQRWLEELYDLHTPDEHSPAERESLHEDILQIIQNTHRWYGLCNYTKGEDDRIHVECPDALKGLEVCPHMWFKPEMVVIGGIRLQPDGPFVCDPALVPELGVLCNPEGCTDGKVCSGLFSKFGTEENELLTQLPVCLTIDDCLHLREQQSLDPTQSCFYDDHSVVVSNDIAVLDCDTLSPGTCTNTCPCANSGDRCAYSSEKNPVGLCYNARCEETRNCDDPIYRRCVAPYNHAERVSAWWRRAHEVSLYDLPLPSSTYCVSSNACDARNAYLSLGSLAWCP